jgi:hypothetical protein
LLFSLLEYLNNLKIFSRKSEGIHWRLRGGAEYIFILFFKKNFTRKPKLNNMSEKFITEFDKKKNYNNNNHARQQHKEEKLQPEEKKKI